jgi:monoamine oxidase
MDMYDYDVLIIGAGASGLQAGLELQLAGKRTAIVEAGNRTGGRIHTILDSGFELPVELGAEFIHGKLERSRNLLKKAGANEYEVKGEIWEKKDGQLKKQEDFIEDYSLLENKFSQLKHDMSVHEFLKFYLEGEVYEDLRFSLKNYVEGYYAADTERASVLALKKELMESDDEQFRVKGGYNLLINYLAEQYLEKGGQIFLSRPVHEVNWSKNQVEVISGAWIARSSKLLVTVSLGVLQSDKIQFSPALIQKTEAAKKLGYGPVIKILFSFRKAFWKNRELVGGADLDKLSFIFSEENIPTWWTYYAKDASMITGWCAGPHAIKMMDHSNDELRDAGLRSLSGIFNIEESYLKDELLGWHVSDWNHDPYFSGAYSYDVVDGSAYKKILNSPEEDTIYFAGEGLFEGPEIGTVEAALVTGRETAFRIITDFKM